MCFELIAYYFAAPYIILLALDEKRGLFDAMSSPSVRFWGYALLVGLYPLLQSIISPYIGRYLDQIQAKVRVLQNIHLANCICYLLLALAAYMNSLSIALIGLAIPGFAGCLSPVGKSLISSLTDPQARVKEFAKIAFIKGAVKLIAPLIGVFIFEWYLDKASYSPLFCLSAGFSLCCFLFSFSLPKAICEYREPQKTKPPYMLFVAFVKQNFVAVSIFISLLLGSSLIVRFTPVVFHTALSDTPSLVNYFSSLVGFSYAINQLITWRFADRLQSFLPAIFILLCATSFLFSVTTFSPLWCLLLLSILFCFSVLTTCTEAKLSLATRSSTQGTLQGILYSIENCSYLAAPFIGTALVSIHTLYPLYFVLILSLIATVAFMRLSTKQIHNLAE
jgi:MFS family permease